VTAQPLKILWQSNAPWCGTGYGQQTRHILDGIVELGHKPTLFAYWGLQGGTLSTGKYPVLPPGRDPYGNDIIGAHMLRTEADICITLIDPWILKNYGEATKNTWYPYTPVDHEPIAPKLKESLMGATEIIAMSHFGERTLREAGFENVIYIPHVVNTTALSRYTADPEGWRHKVLGREPGDFIVGMVAANKGEPSRKGFQQALEAFALFLKKHPNAYLYMHTDPTQDDDGVDMEAYMKLIGVPGDHVQFPERYSLWLGFPDEFMKNMYSALDVLLVPSMGEGFGVPIIEAQACGTPVVGTAFSSIPELIMPGGGYLAAPRTKYITPLKSYQVIPDVNDLADGLEWAYDHRADETVQKVCEENAAQYDKGLILQTHWKPFLERVAEEIGATVATVNVG